MRAIIQRVAHSRVTVEGQCIAEIGAGLVVLLGISPSDDRSQADYLVENIINLRIFEDQAGKINRSLLDIGGSAIVVSQFTLYADTRKGRRPSFTDAATPEIARPLIDYFAGLMAEKGVHTQTGEFGAHMVVGIANDGPLTIWLER